MQKVVQIMIEEVNNQANDYECVGCWLALGMRAHFHGEQVDWSPVFAAINARWGKSGMEEVQKWAHQRFVEAWEHDFNNFLATIGGQSETN